MELVVRAVLDYFLVVETSVKEDISQNVHAGRVKCARGHLAFLAPQFVPQLFALDPRFENGGIRISRTCSWPSESRLEVGLVVQSIDDSHS